MTYAQETKAVCQTTTLVSTKGISNKPNSLGCESCESCETFDKRLEFPRVEARKVSQVNLSQHESCESRANVSQVSQSRSLGCETYSTKYDRISYLSSKFHRFHQFHRGRVGGVSL